MCDVNGETGEKAPFCPMSSPLHFAAFSADVNGLKDGLRRGEDINMIFHTVTPLYVACKLGHMNIVKALIEHRADINAVSVDLRHSPLHVAVSKGKSEVVKYLLSQGALPNRQDCSGSTSLFLAAQYGYTDIAKILICHKCDVNIPNDKGLTPLAAATLNGYNKMVELLIQNKADLDQSDSDGNTALFHAVKTGQRTMCNILTKAGAIINVANFAGEYPISIAAMYGNVFMIDTLISRGCNVNVISSSGTPVFLAVQRQHFNALQRLIAAGADVRLLDKNAGKTRREPLEEATHQSKANLDVVRELIASGSDVDIKCNCHEVLLHSVLSKCNKKVVLTLILAGCKIGHVEHSRVDDWKECCDLIYNHIITGDQPENLKSLCRKTIKRAIGAVHYRKKVEKLNQPTQIENYLLYKDIYIK